MTKRIIRLKVLSTIVERDNIYGLIKEGDNIELVAFNSNLEIVGRLARFKGRRGFILQAKEGSFLINIDDKLLLVSNGDQKVVLKASRPDNFFWHSTNAEYGVFLHEYGEAPTKIFMSENLEDWKALTTNIEIDKHSKHFHYIKYDPYRRWLIATLGDGCLTRAVYSDNMGKSWKPLYKGPWQFIPIVPLRDKVVFGMDSGIVRGGIGIYYPDEDRWDFIFLRWHDKSVRRSQICDLKLLSNGLWIAALGTPQAIVVSKDLKTWYELFVEGFYEEFNHNMKVGEGRDFVACSTGRSLLLFEERELENFINKAKPVMLSYRALTDRLRGLGFTLKRTLLRFMISIA